MIVEYERPAVNTARMGLEEFLQMLKDRKLGEVDEAEAQAMIEFLDEVNFMHESKHRDKLTDRPEYFQT